MSLLSNAMEDCTMLTETITSDGMGGTSSTYTNGTTFKATIIFNSGIETRIAQASGFKSVYTVTTSRETTLKYHDIFKRNRDEKVFRVTSSGEDNFSPASSTLDMRQVSAEEWSLPNG